MDDHFKSVLSTGTFYSKTGGDIVRFIASDAFAGQKPGYYFTTGSKGLGYYYDPQQKDQFVQATVFALNKLSTVNHIAMTRYL